MEEAAAAQKQGVGETARSRERKDYAERFEDMEQRIRAVEARNRALLGRIATMEYNARRLRVNVRELQQPMPKPDRAAPAAGGRES